MAWYHHGTHQANSSIHSPDLCRFCLELQMQAYNIHGASKLVRIMGSPPPPLHGSGCIVHRLDINPRTYTQPLGIMLSRCMSNQASVEENPQQRVTPDYPWQWYCCCAWASICRCRDCSSTAGASNNLKICCTSASMIYNCSAPMQHIDGI